MESPIKTDIDKVELYEFRPIKRSGKWKVQIPKDFTKFKTLLDKVLPVALDDVDLETRKMNVNVFFTDTIVIKEGIGKEVGSSGGRGHINYKDRVFDVIISTSFVHNLGYPNMYSISATEILLHELFEMNYWVKSRRLREKPEQKTLNDKDYRRADHEVVADQNWIRCLQKSLDLDIKTDDDGRINVTVRPEYND